MRYVEAIRHARSGGTAYLGARVIRFLTTEEATPIILEQNPSRRVLRNEDGSVKTEGAGKDEKIVVETYASTEPRDLQALGLYDVGGLMPVQFRPTDEEIAGDWAIEARAEEPTVVAPEVVDEALHETIPETLGTIDTEPPQ